jgi:hypothetical protein
VSHTLEHRRFRSCCCDKYGTDQQVQFNTVTQKAKEGSKCIPVWSWVRFDLRNLASFQRSYHRSYKCFPSIWMTLKMCHQVTLPWVHWVARFGVLRALLMKIKAFWDVTSCWLVNDCRRFDGTCLSWSWGLNNPRQSHFGNYLPVWTAQHLQTLASSGALSCWMRFKICKSALWLRYGLGNWQVESLNVEKSIKFSTSLVLMPNTGQIIPAIQLIPGVFSMKVKRPRREFNNLHPSSAKKTLNYIFTTHTWSRKQLYL